MTLSIVTLDNLGDDFDQGSLVTHKINIERASEIKQGLVRFATLSERTSNASGVVLDAEQVSGKISAAVDPVSASVTGKVNATALAAATGAALVGYKRPETPAVLRLLSARSEEVVYARDYSGTGAGTFSYDFTQNFKDMVQYAPAGATLNFSHGFYDGTGGDFKISDTILLAKHLNLFGNKSRVVGVMPDATKDLIRFDPAVEIRGWRCNGFIFLFNSGGRDALRIGHEGSEVGFLNADISGNLVAGGAGWGFNLVGLGTLFNSLHHNTIYGSTFSEASGKPTAGAVRIASADGTAIYRNVVAGIGCGVLVELFNGAYKTIIGGLSNSITSRDIGVFVAAGQQIDILNNQFEQGTGNPTTDVNQATHKCHVALLGAGIYPAAEDVRDIRLLGNNYGGGSNLDQLITCAGNTLDVTIDDGYFGPLGAAGVDVNILSPTCRATRIGNRMRVGGVRAGITRGTANTTDPKTLIFVNDGGSWTYGFAARKSPALASGWTGTGFSVHKEDGDELHFNGSISVGATAGTNAGGFVIFTLPEGMRPAITTILSVSNNVSTTLSQLVLNPDGTVTCGLGVNLSSTLYVNTAPETVIRGRPSYLSGVL